MERVKGIGRATTTGSASGKTVLREALRDGGIGTASVAEQRRLEKRYGDVKALLKRRAEELGLDMNPKTRGMVRVEDGDRIAKHVSAYDGTHMGLLATNIRNVVNLYDVSIDGVNRELHVIWVFKDLHEFTKNRYRYDAYLKRDGMLYREIYNDIKAANPRQIPDRLFNLMYRDPSLMVRVDEVLLKAFVGAVDFYGWNLVPNGMLITGSTNVTAAVNVGRRKCLGMTHLAYT